MSAIALWAAPSQATTSTSRTDDQTRTIRPLVSNPVAIHGSVLMVPLGCDAADAGRPWPSQPVVLTETGEAISGHIAWIEPRPHTPERHWADAAIPLRVREITSDDEPSLQAAGFGPGGAYLLVELPPEVGGVLELNGHAITPRWHAAAGSVEPKSPAIDRVVAKQGGPFNSWRWHVSGRPAQPAQADDSGLSTLESLVAIHLADLWQTGLARLRSASESVGRRCTDLLTMRLPVDADGRGTKAQTWAAWVTDPDQTQRLLSMLFDDSITGERLVRQAGRWADAQPESIIWPVDQTPHTVTIMVLNRSNRTKIARARWEVRGDIPIALEIPASSFKSFVIDRPQVKNSGETLELSVMLDERTKRFSIAPPILIARPPGVFLAQTTPRLSLADIQRGSQVGIEPERATHTMIRKRAGHWEVFIDCRRPMPDSVSMQERVVISIHTQEHDVTSISIPERGEVSTSGTPLTGSPQVFRASHSDRWYARMVIPDPWLDAFGPQPMLRLSIARDHGESGGTSFAPAPQCPTYGGRPAAHILLTQWDAPLIQ